jgi:cytohesin
VGPVRIVGRPDPGLLDISRGYHVISPWFGYEVRGGRFGGSRFLAFHLVEGERHEAIGALLVDGWSTSVNDRGAAYAISEDGRTLVYLHLLAERGPVGKDPGVYRHVIGEGDHLVRKGAGVLSVGIQASSMLPRNAVAYMSEDDPGFQSPFFGGDLRKANVCRTDGSESPLLTFGGNALHAAVLAGDMTAMREALARGEDREQRTVLGQTPLQIAAELGNADVARVLLEEGADVDATVTWRGIDLGTTALHGAVGSFGKRSVLDALLDGGADANAVAVDGSTPLRSFVDLLPIELGADLGGEGAIVARVERLLDAGADPEIRGSDGNAALHVAVRSGDTAVVEALLRHGANPNARGHRGASPLHFAETPEMADLLLAHGAERNAVNERGEPARILAHMPETTLAVRP